MGIRRETILGLSVADLQRQRGTRANATMSIDLTALLQRAKDGDRDALGELMPAVYDQLHRLAVLQLSRERAGHTLQPTALVNEAFIRLFGEQTPVLRDRHHFLGIAARLMRQVLVDYARTRSSQKRSGGILVTLEEQHAASCDPGTDFLLVEAALHRLGVEDPALVRLIEMRYFAGMTAPEIAEVLDESIHVVRHNLRYAQARLRQDLNQGFPSSGLYSLIFFAQFGWLFRIPHYTAASDAGQPCGGIAMVDRRWMRLCLGLVFGVTLCDRAIQAAPITIQLLGTITQVPIDDLYGDIVGGSPVQISYTFDSAALDQIPGDPSSASYLSAGPPFLMTFTFPSHVFAGADSIRIGILNSFVDQYTVLAFGSGGSDTLELFLQDNSGTVFSSDSLLQTAPSLASFALKDFHLRILAAGGETQVDGQITSVSEVPEPSTAFPLCAAAAILWALGRRRSGTNSQPSLRS